MCKRSHPSVPRLAPRWRPRLDDPVPPPGLATIIAVTQMSNLSTADNTAPSCFPLTVSQLGPPYKHPSSPWTSRRTHPPSPFVQRRNPARHSEVLSLPIAINFVRYAAHASRCRRCGVPFARPHITHQASTSHHPLYKNVRNAPPRSADLFQVHSVATVGRAAPPRRPAPRVFRAPHVIRRRARGVHPAFGSRESSD